MTAEHVKVFNEFNGMVVGKDNGTVSVDYFKKLTDYSYAVSEQYERNFNFVLQNKKPLDYVCRESEMCDGGELLLLAKQAAGRKTLGNRKRGVKFINPPNTDYYDYVTDAICARKARLDYYERSFDGILGNFAAQQLKKIREKERQEQIERAARKRKQEQQRAEAERKEREYRLQQEIAAEIRLKRKQRIKKIIGTCVCLAAGIILGILYILDVW